MGPDGGPRADHLGQAMGPTQPAPYRRWRTVEALGDPPVTLASGLGHEGDQDHLAPVLATRHDPGREDDVRRLTAGAPGPAWPKVAFPLQEAELSGAAPSPATERLPAIGTAQVPTIQFGLDLGSLS